MTKVISDFWHKIIRTRSGLAARTSLQQSATLETTSRASGVRVTRCAIHTRCIATIYGVGIGS